MGIADETDARRLQLVQHLYDCGATGHANRLEGTQVMEDLGWSMEHFRDALHFANGQGWLDSRRQSRGISLSHEGIAFVERGEPAQSQASPTIINNVIGNSVNGPLQVSGRDSHLTQSANDLGGLADLLAALRDDLDPDDPVEASALQLLAQAEEVGEQDASTVGVLLQGVLTMLAIAKPALAGVIHAWLVSHGWALP